MKAMPVPVDAAAMSSFEWIALSAMLVGIAILVSELRGSVSRAHLKRLLFAFPITLLLAGAVASADAVKPLDCADIEPWSMLWIAYGCWWSN